MLLLQRNSRMGGYDVLDAQRRYRGWTPSILKARCLFPHPMTLIGRACGFTELLFGRIRRGWKWNGRTIIGRGVGAAVLGGGIVLDLDTGEVFRREHRPRGQIRVIG